MQFALIALLFAFANADVYMHNPKGSNDRLNGAGTNRNNAERLFNSQNNAKGGYPINVGDPWMNFYEGSWLTVEWTNQHACGTDNTDCAIILQYMCGKGDEGPETLIRDGTTTDTIEEDNYDETAKVKGETVYKYGMHESLYYKQRAEARDRNKGLFIADRNLNGENSMYTRQNNGGTRHGFESAEEKDYYPYWHPTPWKDIAVFTNDIRRCDWYRAESQNVKDKGHCEPSEGDKASDDKKKEAWKWNNKAECGDNGHTWKEEWTAHQLPPPDCLQAPWSRDNHLGNGITDTLAGQMNHYNWTLPSAIDEPCIGADNCRCVLRIRYNTSTTDYKMFGDRFGYGDFVDHRFNGKEKTPLAQDPTISVAGKTLSHALNSNQVARTFQDRSHIFSIRKRPAGITGNQRILNINVRGKRGNVVQTFPAVEYDFVPTHLIARQGDFVHFQWCGFDNQPNNGNNNGEGTDGTDRSNVCQISDMGSNHCMCDTDACYQKLGGNIMIDNAQLRHKLAYLDQDPKECKTRQELLEIHQNNGGQVEQDKRYCDKLNAAESYADFEPVQMTRPGTFYYMSSRNNNFTNRSQKASITVLPILSNWAIAVVAVAGALAISSMCVAGMVVRAKLNPDLSYAKMFDRI